MHFITPATEFCNDIFGEELGIAACHINIADSAFLLTSIISQVSFTVNGSVYHFCGFRIFII